MPNRLAILKRQSANSSWVARLADSPAAEFPGGSPAEALSRLLHGNGWSITEVELSTDHDRSNLSAGHAEVVITVHGASQESVYPSATS